MIFEEEFNRFKRDIEKIGRKYVKSNRIPLPEMISHLNEEFWQAFKTFNPDAGCSFKTWVSIKLAQKALDVIRYKEGKYHKRVLTVLDGKSAGDEEAPTSEIASDYDLEEEVIQRFSKKKEADKRQLIDFLLQSAKTDDVTTAIVTNFSQHKSITALAKALGLHHEIVKRKLRSLSRHYDANRFGDINDYLAG